MDISGRSLDNLHEGNTLIEGNLTVTGDLQASGADVKSEYLDSGTYTPTISTPTAGWSVLLQQAAVYKKNGNLITVGVDISVGWTAPTTNPVSIRITVPSQDLFEADVSIYAFASGSILGRYSVSNVIKINASTYNVTFNTADVFTVSATANVSLILVYKLEGADVPASVLVIGGTGGTGDVKNPLLSTLNAGGYDIINVGDLQATTFNGGTLLNNPLTTALDMDSNNITNIATADAQLMNTNSFNAIAPNTTINVLSDLTFDETNIYQLSSIFNGGLAFGINAPNISITGPTTYNSNINMNANSITGAAEVKTDVLYTGTVAHPIGPNDILFNDTIDLQTKNIKNVGTLQTVSSITFSPSGSGIVMNSKPIDMVGGNIDNAATIQCVDIEHPLPNNSITFNSDIATNSKPIDLNGSFIDNCSLIANLGDIDIKTISNNITLSNTTSGDIKLSTPSGDLSIISGTTSFVMNNAKIEQFALRVEGSTSGTNKIDTVNIYATSGFNETVVGISGFDYYDLLPNCTYIIHNQITVTNGFNFGVNTVIRGASTSASITFDESTKNIIGFRASDQNLIVQDLTTIGGGGHFNSTNVGLFQGSNFNTGAASPFYGRNKRCLISGCNVVAPFSLGKIQGFGTTNILSNFINGGGGTPASTYTTHGLDVSDGLSFELRGNKMVLFKGAQTTSTLKMINFVDSVISPVVLGINAVIITGNIIHPRDAETGINFENGALVELGTISANTLIRTGGVAALIGYQNQTLFDNYNVKSIEHFEISGNAGIIDSEPVLEIPTGIHNQITSATWIDLDIPITSIGPINMSKRFAVKFIATGVTGGSYKKGNFIESTTSPTIRGYIVDVQQLTLTSDIVYITDMNGIFPDLLGYREVDASLTSTGIASAGLQIGSNSDNLELYYFDRDSHDIQFGCQISYENDQKEKEINFRFSKVDGASYVGLENSIIQSTNPRQDRGDSASLIHLVRMNFGDLIKIEYQYVDAVNTTITRMNWTGK